MALRPCPAPVTDVLLRPYGVQCWLHMEASTDTIAALDGMHILMSLHLQALRSRGSEAWTPG